MSFALRSRREVAVLAGLIIAGILPFAKAKALPPKVRTNRTAYGAVQAELSNLSPVSRIRSWNGDMYTRVVIDVGSQVKYRSARIPEPDRIYFDIDDAKLASEMVGKPIDVGEGDLLKGIRAAQNRTGILRVVLDVNQVKNYSVSLLPDPYRLVVDLYRSSATVKADASNRVPPPAEPASKYLPFVKTEAVTTGAVAVARAKSTGVKSELVAFANTSDAESRSLQALLPSNAASSPGGKQSPRRETGINAAKGSEKYVASAAKPSTAQAGEIGASALSSNSSPVSFIRTSNGDMHTRVVIDVGSEVKYRSTRISEPDRIYFDIEGAKLTSAMVHKPTDVGDDVLLKGVRVAQNRDGISRVVLDVNQVKDYSVSLLPDPYRLVVDLYGASATVKADAPNRVPPAEPAAKYPSSVKTENTSKGAAAAAPAKSTEASTVKPALVPHSNNSAVEPRSLPALTVTPPSSRMGVEPPAKETASNPAKDSEKLDAVSKSNTTQDGEVAASTPPPAAAEKPATHAPKVTYQDGQLTIIAENSLLSDILSALHTAMGAEIDLPAGASSDHVWVSLGPGPARKVVSELLSGTDLNFVIQGSTTDVGGIQSVMLTPHSEGGPGNPGTSSQLQERMANLGPSGPAEPATASADPLPPAENSPRLSPQSMIAASLTSAVPESVAHPSPPESMNSENVRQELVGLYQQRRQLQQAQQSTPANPHP